MEDNTGIFPEFYIKATEIPSRTLKEGRPIFENVEWVRLHVAGDSKSRTEKKVRPQIITRFQKYYDAWKNGQEMATEGMPLEEWPIMTASRVAELKAQNIRSVEDLSGLRDSALDKLGLGGRELRAQAIAYLETAKDSAYAVELATELEKRDTEISMLKEQLAEMNSNMEALKAGNEPKPRGRPKKVAA